MNFKQYSLAALLALSGLAANATVVGGLGGNTDAGSFVALINGVDVIGRNGVNPVYSASVSLTATMPTATVGNFLAATATPNSDATFVLSAPSSYVSFDWGSIDPYNTLYVFEGNNMTTFTAADMGLTVGTDAYVHFTAASADITALVFHDDNVNAFEAANFAVSAVPEPSNVAFLLAGLGAVGLLTRKRRVGA